MRRLARWLFTFCSAASLLLCVAVCVLCARSEGPGLWSAVNGKRYTLRVADGRLTVFAPPLPITFAGPRPGPKVTLPPPAHHVARLSNDQIEWGVIQRGATVWQPAVHYVNRSAADALAVCGWPPYH